MTTKTTINAVGIGDRVMYPCWVDGHVEMCPVTIEHVVEYPANRVLYTDLGMAVAARTAVVDLA